MVELLFFVTKQSSTSIPLPLDKAKPNLSSNIPTCHRRAGRNVRRLLWRTSRCVVPPIVQPPQRCINTPTTPASSLLHVRILGRLHPLPLRIDKDSLVTWGNGAHRVEDVSPQYQVMSRPAHRRLPVTRLKDPSYTPPSLWPLRTVGTQQSCMGPIVVAHVYAHCISRSSHFENAKRP